MARAKTALRRFVVANVLTRMWTLTYAEEHWDRQQVMRDVNDFLQRLREHLGEAFPAAYVLELHPKGHGLHVHIALQSRFIRWELLGQLWGHGHVQYSDGAVAIRNAGSKRAQSRRLAQYLTKYMAKGWADQHDAGDHRYEVTQGFQPETSRRVFYSLAAALDWLDSTDGAPATQWCSDSAEDWEGPPVWAFRYD